MFLRFLLVVFLFGDVLKGETTGTSGSYTTSDMASSSYLDSTTPGIITTSQVHTTSNSSVEPTINTLIAESTITISSPDSPSAPTMTTPATSTSEQTRPTSSETAATTVTPVTTQNTTTSSPVTLVTTKTLSTNKVITNATSTSITSTTESGPTTGITNTSDYMTTKAPVTPTSGNASTSQVTPTDSKTTANPPPSSNTITLPVTLTDSSSPVVTATTPINITTPTQTSDRTTATSEETSTSTNTSETSTATAPPSSIVTTNTGLPSSSPSSISTSSFLSTITSSDHSTSPLTGHTTSFSPTTPATGVTITTTENITIPNSTTASPSSTTPMSNVTTAALTTLQPTTTVISSTAAPPTLSPVIVCPSDPCPAQSVCLNRTCQCLSGSYMQKKRCVPAQVFPGRLHLKSLTFTNGMSDRSSREFQNIAAQISAALSNILKNEAGYIQSDVVQLQPGSVIATVNNIFKDTSITQDSVNGIITQALSNSTGFLSSSSYTGINPCEVEPLPCDVSTTLCTNTSGQSVCSCREGYISIVYSNNSCKACPSGQRAAGDSCQPCSFGYAGFNCDDSALLAVVVVSCVLGGILFILIVALLCYCCWRRCLGRHPFYTSSPYSDDLNKTWPVAITPIPRATNNWDAAASIEMTETDTSNVVEEKKPQTNGLSGSYDLNPDEMKTFTGKYTSRYSYLVQGHENPYFLPGDEKKD